MLFFHIIGLIIIHEITLVKMQLIVIYNTYLINILIKNKPVSINNLSTQQMFITALFTKLSKNRTLLHCDFLTIVLDDAFEVVCHQVPQGTFVGQTETVRKHNGRVYD